MPYDQIVIGAGVVGAATARAIAEAGCSVLLLEAFERGHDRGSSHGASRIFRHGYAEQDYIRLSLRARDAWRALETATGTIILELTGAIDHGDPEAVAAIEAALDEAGIPSERLDAAAAEERWQGLRFETDVLFAPSGGRLRADAAIDALLSEAESAGSELRFATPVDGIAVTDHGVVVSAEGERFDADGVVVAAGSWTPTLIGGWLAEQGSPLPPVRVTEEQPAHFPLRPIAADAAPAVWPSFVHHRPAGPDGVPVAEVYGLLTPGEGVKVGLHGTGPVVDPSKRDRTIDRDRLAELTSYTADWVPGVDASAPVPISCLYDSTDTEDFVLDRVGPVTVATGFSGHGFKFGPALGDILAGLALRGVPAPERFRLRRPA